MAITSQTWTKYTIEDNPVGPGDVYTAQTLLDHINAFFTANTSQWTISSSGTNYLELKPPVGVSAIDENDRVLFWAGATPDSAALQGNTTGNASYFYCCYAPSAGTTGPDNLPSVGEPYTGVTSSLLLLCMNTFTSRDKLEVYQSNDCLCFYVGRDVDATGTNLMFVGRAFNPVGTTDQYPIVAGMGGAPTDNWCESLRTQTSNWVSDNSFSGTDQRIVFQTETDGYWFEGRRINSWRDDQYRNGFDEERYFFNILLGKNRSAEDQMGGTVLFAKGGPGNPQGTTVADSGGTLGYAQSTSETLDTNGTWYLWNE